MSTRAPRTLVQKLAPMVLGFEAIVVLLIGFTLFGLKALPDGVEQWWAIVGAVVVALAMLAVAGMISRPWAITTGWLLQAVVALSAIFEPTIVLAVLVFGGMWAYATIMGARLDARRPADNSTTATDNETHTESD